MKSLNSLLPFIVGAFLVVIFFWQFFLKGLLPIPADAIVGLYYPYRDFFAAKYPNGVPFKNYLITDPVRQQFPWKKLVIESEKKGTLPLWNPYEMAGKPLLGNFQSGAFYPLNLLFFIFPFNIGWSLYIVLQPLFLIFFTYLFLKNIGLSKLSSLFGSFVFAFSGFSIAWLEWGNILHTALWLPLILFSTDKILSERRPFKWFILLTYSLLSSFFAGHLQIFFYLFIVFIAYLFFRILKTKEKIKLFLPFIVIFFVLSSIQSLPTFNFIIQSARNVDLAPMGEGWFIPWQNLIQFIAPDFFGNPATLNYWGVWNYAEFVGYIGIFPLVLALSAIFFKRDRNVFFFGLLFFLSLTFALPTFIAKIPYFLNIPFISTAQPTRLIFISDFSLSILSGIGLDYLVKSKKEIYYVLGFVGLFLLLLWSIVLKSQGEAIIVAKQNMLLPTIIFAISSVLIFIGKIGKKAYPYTLFLLLAIVIFDLFRFGWKFTPFTREDYLFPQTETLKFLENQKGIFRVMSTDSRIFPPNFSTSYRIQSVDGYDPLYIESYGEFISAVERKRPDINPPFGFNRIITPHNYSSGLIDLLGVRYIMSLDELKNPNIKKVFQEGQTKVYENSNYFPRAFFVQNTIDSKGKKDSIKKLFASDGHLFSIGVVDGLKDSRWSSGSAEFLNYDSNEIDIRTENKDRGFLVLTDTYYSSWHAEIDRSKTQIYKTDYNFRGIIVPKGKHVVKFYTTLL